MTGESLQPEAALADWRQWSDRLGACPAILEPLHGGRSNHSYLLGSGIGRLVLRISGAGTLLPGADRRYETGIWQAASRQGIAPPLQFVDPQHRYLVSAYIDTVLPPRAQHDPAIIGQACELLERCHRLDADAPVIDYRAHIEHYWQLIGNSEHPAAETLLDQREPMNRSLASLLKSNTPTGLCHHDPVIENFVGTAERLYLIDWEYAATGLQIMDYAAMASEWQIDDATILAKTGLDPEPFQSAKALYQYLCALWEAATK